MNELVNAIGMSWELLVMLCIFASLSGVATVKIDEYKNKSEPNE